MTISVITVAFNSASTIGDTLASVASQNYLKVEHVVIDGGSTDGTLDVLAQKGRHVAEVVSEPDGGIYDAMNKGLARASGDIVGFLNSDDYYTDPYVISDVAKAAAEPGVGFVYGDIRMVDDNEQVVRDWKTGRVPPEGLVGRQIPHPALFIRRDLLNTVRPAFDPKYRIASDLKQQLIIINQKRAKGIYVARALTVMRVGGTSTSGLGSYLAGWRESASVYNDVFGRGGVWFTVRKVLSKLRGLRRF